MSAAFCPKCGEAVPDPPAPPSLRCSADAYQLVGRALARHRQERFVVVALDARNRIVRRHLVAVGSLASVTVHPREVFAPLVRGRAAACILMHNHPSQVVDPSPDDFAVTRRLVEGERLLGIPVLDHLIVARDGYYSLRDHGMMDSNAGDEDAGSGSSCTRVRRAGKMPEGGRRGCDDEEHQARLPRRTVATGPARRDAQA